MSKTLPLILISFFLFVLSATSAFSLIHPIEYLDTGFTPQNITLLQNNSIQITNSSSADLDLFSASFSSQKDNSTFNRGTIAPNTTITLTLTELGEHIIQNRSNRSHNLYISIITKPFPISSEIPFTSTTSADTLDHTGTGDNLSAGSTSLIREQDPSIQLEQLTEKQTTTTGPQPITLNQKIQHSLDSINRKNDSGSTTIIQLIILTTFIFTGITLTLFVFAPKIKTYLDQR